MQNKEQIFVYMKDEIEHLAKSEEEKILAEAKQLEEQAYQQIKEEAQIEAEKQLEKELDEISLQESMQASLVQDQRKQALVKQREEYVETIFNEAKIKLQEFVASDQYLSYLVKNVEEVKDLFVGQQPVLYVRQEDIKYTKDLQKAYGQTITIEESKDITIGGFTIEVKETQVFLDKTLDMALANQYDWFYQTSGLHITMDGVKL